MQSPKRSRKKIRRNQDGLKIEGVGDHRTATKIRQTLRQSFSKGPSDPDIQAMIKLPAKITKQEAIKQAKANFGGSLEQVVDAAYHPPRVEDPLNNPDPKVRTGVGKWNSQTVHKLH